ncbi:MAG: large repetitive protein, partial [Frankiaceae bacterium]|nr:large repetitive protein [Frankiaceae bacterium]
TVTYSLDTVAPLAPVVGLASAIRSSDKNPLWTWEYGPNDLDTSVDTATCTIHGPHGYTSVKINCGHHYSPTLGGLDGVYTLTVTLTDPAGNTASQTSPSYTLDDTAPPGPTVFLKHPSHFAGLDRHPVWSVSGPGTLMCTLLRGGRTGTPIAPEAVCPTPTTYSLVGLNDGEFTLKVIAVDSVHNPSSPAFQSYVLAPSAPDVQAPKGNSATAVWTVISNGNPRDTNICTLIHAGAAVVAPRACSDHPTFDMSGRPAGSYTLSVVQVGAQDVHSAPGTASWTWVVARANNHPSGGPPPPNGNNNPTGPTVPGGLGPRHKSPNSVLPPPVRKAIGLAKQGLPHAGGALSGIVPPFIQNVHPNRLADAVTSAVQGVVQAVGSAGGGTGFPLLLLGFVLAFLIAQNRIDRRDPKLALASIAADDLVEFRLPPSRRDWP